MAEAGETKGDLYCWGLNENGQVGVSGPGDSNCLNSETLDEVGCYVTPQKVPFPPGAVSGISEVCGGIDYTCAITEPSGTLYCWGDYTQTGIVNTLVAPAGASVALDVQNVSCGLYHVCALTGSGQISCFGNNNYGEGQSSLSYSSLGESFRPAQLAAGAHHSCMAGTTVNSVYCWGDNALGQMGICTNVGTYNVPQDTALQDPCPPQP
jgi:alpha-tubulin suppressor-like RCC1 family protein